jgi:cytochrome b subunit of formate dehydrogenase
MYMGTGFGFSIAVLLTFLIKFLFVVFIIGLVGGLIVAAKNYIFTPEDIENFKATFKINKTTAAKQTCSICGKEVNPEWQACPYCSATIEK